MSKRNRFLLILLTLFICGLFLYPSFNWYFMVSQDKKDLATSSRDAIRNYAGLRANEDLQELKALLEEGADLPSKFRYLVEEARNNLRTYRMEIPSQWPDIISQGFYSENEVHAAIQRHQAREILDLKDRSEGILKLGLDLSGGMNILLQADFDSLAARIGSTPTEAEREDAMERAVEILNSRIDAFGLSEPSIRRQGDDQINIEIPGAADPEVVDRFLRGRGRLNFHIADDEATSLINRLVEEKGPGGAAEILGPDGQPRDTSLISAGYVVRGQYEKDAFGEDLLVRYMVVREEPGLSGEHIVNAQVGADRYGRTVVNFQLSDEGGEIFFQLTSASQGKILAIVLDDQVKAGARVNEPIRSNVQMSGFDRTEALDISRLLRTASMPIDLVVDSQQAVGASLGDDAIRAGIQAIAVGFLLVIFFMLLYYKAAGLIAVVALVLNLFLIVGVLSAFNLTLSLTSIAGLILTVGMAVDANVIIFERIKEEARLGKSPEAAVKAGFEKAFSTVADANITTFIAALFLSLIGTGQIKGFAYTLAVGIVCSMFTALFVSRLIFDFSLESMKIKKLSIGWRIK